VYNRISATWPATTGYARADCPTNKTVECDSVWFFDLPGVWDGSAPGTNVSLWLISSNGVWVNPCLTVYTGVWLRHGQLQQPTGPLHAKVMVWTPRRPSSNAQTNITVFSCTNLELSYSTGSSSRQLLHQTHGHLPSAQRQRVLSKGHHGLRHGGRLFTTQPVSVSP